jgi:small multidrug resistance pump
MADKRAGAASIFDPPPSKLLTSQPSHHLPKTNHNLANAIVAEVIATSSLKATDGFSRLLPSLIVACGYGVAFYFLSLTLRVMSVGIAYAIWCGAGIVLVALISWIVLGQRLDAPAIGGMALIIAGVVVINLFSKSVSH